MGAGVGRTEGTGWANLGACLWPRLWPREWGQDGPTKQDGRALSPWGLLVSGGVVERANARQESDRRNRIGKPGGLSLAARLGSQGKGGERREEGGGRRAA